MKHFVMIGLMSTGLLLGAQAQAAGKWYVHASAGAVKYSEDDEVVLDDDSDTAFSAGFGYQLGENSAVELAYNDFGAAVTGGTDLEFSSISVAWVGGVPLSDNLTLIGKLGVERLKGEANLRVDNPFVSFNFNVEDDSTEAFAGLGLDYAFNDSVSLRAGVDLHDGADINVLQAGLKVRF